MKSLITLVLLGAITLLPLAGCVVHDRDYHHDGYYHDDMHRVPPPPPDHHDDIHVDVHP